MDAETLHRAWTGPYPTSMFHIMMAYLAVPRAGEITGASDFLFQGF